MSFVRTSYFEKITSSGESASAFGVRSISGNCRVLGFSMIPRFASDASGGINTLGTIKFEDVNVAGDGGTGTALIEVPINSMKGYPTATYVGLSDDDGYVEFERGVYLNDTTEGVIVAPLINYAILIFHQGGVPVQNE